MGVKFKDIVLKENISLDDLSGKTLALDAYNFLHQFLSSIRQRNGELLVDSKGRVTSHLTGLFYRTINLLEKNIKPIYVFDGKPPSFKYILKERQKVKEKALEKLREAKEQEDVEKIRLYSQQTSYLTDSMIKDSKKLLDLMGISWVQAPSEGEAQCVNLLNNHLVYAVASQDYDSLLFGAEILIRNLSISGKKKVPGKNEYFFVSPEKIVLSKTLKHLEINREKLIILAMLIGTDYNKGIKGIGPKTALKIVKENTVKNLFKKYNLSEEIFNWFLNPKVKDIKKISNPKININKLREFLLDFDFSEKRINQALNRLKKIEQKSLDIFFT